MELALVTKLNKKMTTSSLTTTSFRQVSKNILQSLNNYRAICKSDTGRMVFNTYIFINSNTRGFIILLWETVLFLRKKCIKKYFDLSKMKEFQILKTSSWKLHFSLYLCTKFQVSSITFTSSG